MRPKERHSNQTYLLPNSVCDLLHMFAHGLCILFHANASPRHFPFSSTKSSDLCYPKFLNPLFILTPFRCSVLLSTFYSIEIFLNYPHTMAMSKASSNLSNHQKEKQRAYDYPPTNARTVSCDGDSTRIRPLHHNTPIKPLHPSQAGKSAMTTDGSKLADDLPQLTFNEEEPPLPPPEITSASVMAMTRLKNTLSDLLDAINYYEEFDSICHGKYANLCKNPRSS